MAQPASRVSGGAVPQNRVRWAIPFECSMRHEPIRNSLCSHLIGGFTEAKASVLEAFAKACRMASEWIERLSERSKSEDQVRPDGSTGKTSTGIWCRVHPSK
jgi:hypothetical protein